MNVNLWYCKEMDQWRWTLTDNRRPIVNQESGQNKDFRIAIKEIESSLELLLKKT